MAKIKQEIHSKESCTKSLAAVKDALYVLNGKWKLPVIIALNGGALRFKELQRMVEGITPKILSKELKELELNDFLTRKVNDTRPVTVEYKLTEYSDSLKKVIAELQDWGMKHRKRVFSKSKEAKEAGSKK